MLVSWERKNRLTFHVIVLVVCLWCTSLVYFDILCLGWLGTAAKIMNTHAPWTLTDIDVSIVFSFFLLLFQANQGRAVHHKHTRSIAQVNQLENARKLKSIGINTTTGVISESLVANTKPIKNNTFFGSE